MPKTITKAQRRRGMAVKAKLGTILKKIQSIIDEYDLRETNGLLTRDGENLLGCLTNAKLELENAEEYYTTYL